MTKLVWVDRPSPKEERRRKLDVNGSRSRVSGGGGGIDTLQNIGVDSQLQVMERFGELITVVHSENFRCPMAEDGRKIYLHYHSKR